MKKWNEATLLCLLSMARLYTNHPGLDSESHDLDLNNVRWTRDMMWLGLESDFICWLWTGQNAKKDLQLDLGFCASELWLQNLKRLIFYLKTQRSKRVNSSCYDLNADRLPLFLTTSEMNEMNRNEILFFQTKTSLHKYIPERNFACENYEVV